MTRPAAPAPVLVWLRRDLRIEDHPAIGAATALANESGATVLPLVVLDETLALSETRRARYGAAVDALAACLSDLGGSLLTQAGDPREVLPDVAQALGATHVVVSGEHTPHARRRDAAVADRLASRGVVMTSAGSCHVLAPGTVRTKAGTQPKVFTPFFRTWLDQVRRDLSEAPPLGPAPEDVPWHHLDTSTPHRDDAPAQEAPIQEAPAQEAGEAAALHRWDGFRADMAGYAADRDLPAADATSRLSIALRLGEVHPARLVADLLDDHADRAAANGEAPGDVDLDADVRKFLAEIAWRDFHADVLWHRPEALWVDMNPAPAGIHDEPGEQFDAWREGRTGYPLVDAGMRQLLAEGWMHNRVRMVTASFLVKDLLLPWQVGARHFLEHLLDGDPASNNLGWQWVAGVGTDAAPYHRVMNPTAQATRFDPRGEYVRQWIPELRHLGGKKALEPWKHDDGHSDGYPRPIVDHSEQRTEALLRWRNARA
ncbi:cryptochrome/photolyase family protein [Nocardioides yefusunii]|uniref:Cryptochrome/photolyase family protein n=1 Tax=Nocardioides yefusunii TaxID=2500546 RepID=A0ABW1QU28_9ACTN|nr:deoxyribodipyrimidine photo-lyase [Nocardioides yefusunii]